MAITGLQLWRGDEDRFAFFPCGVDGSFQPLCPARPIDNPGDARVGVQNFIFAIGNDDATPYTFTVQLRPQRLLTEVPGSPFSVAVADRPMFHFQDIGAGEVAIERILDESRLSESLFSVTFTVTPTAATLVLCSFDFGHSITG